MPAPTLPGAVKEWGQKEKRPLCQGWSLGWQQGGKLCRQRVLRAFPGQRAQGHTWLLRMRTGVGWSARHHRVPPDSQREPGLPLTTAGVELKNLGEKNQEQSGIAFNNKRAAAFPCQAPRDHPAWQHRHTLSPSACSSRRRIPRAAGWSGHCTPLQQSRRRGLSAGPQGHGQQAPCPAAGCSLSPAGGGELPPPQRAGQRPAELGTLPPPICFPAPWRSRSHTHCLEIKSLPGLEESAMAIAGI